MTAFRRKLKGNTCKLILILSTYSICFEHITLGAVHVSKTRDIATPTRDRTVRFLYVKVELHRLPSNAKECITSAEKSRGM